MKYTAPEMKIVKFEAMEVIVASGVVDECPQDIVIPGDGD